jgi:hypothetical protein
MVNSKPSYYKVKKLLDYNPDTGVFKWYFKGENLIAGRINSNGYRVIKIDGMEHPANRLAFMWMVGIWVEVEIIHKNKIKDDTRWCNLITYPFKTI